MSTMLIRSVSDSELFPSFTGINHDDNQSIISFCRSMTCLSRLSSTEFNQQQPTSTTLLPIWSKQLIDDIDSIRRENFLLTSTVLKNNDDIKQLLNKQQRLQQTLKELSNDYHMNQYLERCLRDVHLDEQDLNRKIEQRLQYITDMNQLLQLKLNMLETKFGEHILLNPLSIPLPLKRLSSLSSNSNGQQNH
ncbi:hypothetical protein DERP_006051 [Dermatophagoides pteronyssinus]|uniref:Uncharacterized protein n=1 Tax=Dermatophagoides pteronyssinus TaxID=6956 RepID=A0ABQ8JS58_DERPT|nr:hypothetical protein DERP_006051 [Dermatophagoides pteronyssinus]